MQGQGIKLICLDLDSTLIPDNSWFKLNLAFGITAKEDEEMFKAYISGQLEYSAWLDKLAALYKERGLANADLAKKVLLDYELKPEIKEVMGYLRDRSYKLVIISGSFLMLTRAVAGELGIDRYEANTELQFSENGDFIDIKSGGEEKFAKVRYLEAVCSELGITLTECACIGDGRNDAEIFKKTGHGIVFEGHDFEGQVWKTIKNWSDLKSIF
ncbi:MAG: HAD family phosphatase [Candidatus Nomurabacteria bacterium]|nr:MAG: HAD family phosphatase [Candidatus Nomurabacteria bacterium]